jgi:N-acetylneuraminate synthase
VDFLAGLGACAYKIASFEAVDLPLIAKAAEQRKPLVISTGMTTIQEIEEAVGTAQKHGAAGLVLLHCVSNYPATAEDSNLRTIPDLRDRFGTLVGLSDHTHGTAVSVAAVALGACVIEKHMTIRRADGGPDAEFSLEPEEFADLVDDCRVAWAALGRVDYDRGEQENKNKIFRRSLYVVADIRKGEAISEANVRSIRPGFGLAPKHLWDVLGKKAARDLTRGTPLTWDAVE